MKKNKFVILCLRLLGIYFVVLGLSSLPSVIAVFSQTSNTELFYYIGPFVFIASGLILFVFANSFSTFIIEFSEAEENDIQITASEKTARIAFIILGIFIFSQALPQLIQVTINVGLYYIRIDELPKHLRGQQPRWTILIGPTIKLFIGVVLIIGSDKIIGFIAKYDDTFKRIKSSNNGIKSD
jgi:hypothetical protein